MLKKHQESNSIMLLVDVHCHLDHSAFRKNLKEVISRAKKAGLATIITSGVNSASNMQALKISHTYDIVKPSLGIYPIDALGIAMPHSGLKRPTMPIDIDAELAFIEQHASKIVAVGECGMDFHAVKGYESKQKENFEKIIALVERIKKPIIVHSRKAELEAIEMLESSSIKKIVLHCFSGNKKLILRAADNGWFFSIPPIITRLQHFQMLTDIVNINQLLTETDAPWLSPYYGKLNEPAFVIEAVKKIAEVKSLSVEETANNIWKNFQMVFE